VITILNKKIITPIVIIGTAGITLFGVTQIHAQDVTPTPFQGLAEVLAKKFNLNQTDVQNTILDYRKTRITDMLKIKLDKLVNDKKITQDQETAIINKVNSLSGPNKIADLNAWLKSQNIDPKIFPRFGKIRKNIRHSTNP
jgi:hypothetical protein